MITAAILAMEEKDGSSSQAIANYIICEFKTLDASLLARHLRKMKNMGRLVMNKRSYMLPGSGDGVGAGQSQSQSVVGEGSSIGGKRKPGRPPKMQSNDGGVEAGNGGGGGSVSGAVGITAPAPSNVVRMGEVDGGSGFLGVTAPVLVPFDPIGAVRNVVPMGEADEGTVVKRRLGRPPKMQVVAVEAETIAVADPGVGGEMVKVGRKPGRPPKVSNGEKVVPVGGKAKVNDEIVVGEGGSVLGKRRRERLVKKTGRSVPPKMRAIGLGMGQRPRGRPRKGDVIFPVGGMGDAGRPSKLAVRRKPLGRPKKGASEQAILSSSQQQLILYEDLKGIFQQFQKRVKYAVDVVKPYLSNEIAPVALRVLQEIEGLALMDVCAPVPGGVLIGDSEAVAGPNGAPLSDGGQLNDPVAAFSAQGSEPPN